MASHSRLISAACWRPGVAEKSADKVTTSSCQGYYLSRFALVLARKIAADEPVTVQRGNPAQRAGCHGRHRPAGEQEAIPHIHLFVVGPPDRADHRPGGQPDARAAPGRHFPDAFLEHAVRASALARTMSGSRGSG